MNENAECVVCDGEIASFDHLGRLRSVVGEELQNEFWPVCVACRIFEQRFMRPGTPPHESILTAQLYLHFECMEELLASTRMLQRRNVLQTTLVDAPHVVPRDAA